MQPPNIAVIMVEILMNIVQSDLTAEVTVTLQLRDEECRVERIRNYIEIHIDVNNTLHL